MTGWARAAAAAILLSAIANPVWAQAPGHPPAEYFGQLPALRSPGLSPDGKHLLMIQSFEGRPLLAIYTIGAPAGTKPVAIPSPDWIIAGARWLKNDRVIMYLTKDEKLGFQYEDVKALKTWTKAIIIGIDGGDSVIPFRHNKYYANNTGIAGLADVDVADPDGVFIPFYVDADNLSPAEQAQRLKSGQSSYNHFELDIFRVSAHSGEDQILDTGSDATTNWFMDGNGNVVARIDRTQSPLLDHLKVKDGGGWREIASYDATGDASAGIKGLSPDGNALVRAKLDGNGIVSAYAVDLKSGAETPLYSNPEHDIADFLYDEWSFRVIGASYGDDTTQNHYFDPKMQDLQAGVDRAFPGMTASVVSLDLTGQHAIVSAENPQHPPAFYYLDRSTHQATEIGPTYPGLNPPDLGEMRPYPYAARDGLQIHAYLTLPPGKPDRNLPLVVFPHGGPDNRDGIGFGWATEFLANRGYAVFHPNYRGSFGYGRKFLEAGFHQWGLKMQDDITDGVKKLIADGIVDPKRICIAGEDYGGYAALAGATFTPDLYACAISIGGASDLSALVSYERAQRMHINSNHDERKTDSLWEQVLGAGMEDAVRLAATSPAQHAYQVRCPILLIHIEGDSDVPIAQSEEEESALKGAGRNVRLVRLDGDDHWLRLAPTRIQMLKEMESFLAANIGN